MTEAEVRKLIRLYLHEVLYAVESKNYPLSSAIEEAYASLEFEASLKDQPYLREMKPSVSQLQAKKENSDALPSHDVRASSPDRTAHGYSLGESLDGEVTGDGGSD